MKSFMLMISLSCSPFQNVLAKALYDNVAESPDELSFRKGDIMTVLERDTQGLDGWWLCSLHGRQGIVPGNRLKILVGMYDKQQQLQAQQQQQQAMPTSQAGPGGPNQLSLPSQAYAKPPPGSQYIPMHPAYSSPSPASQLVIVDKEIVGSLWQAASSASPVVSVLTCSYSNGAKSRDFQSTNSMLKCVYSMGKFS